MYNILEAVFTIVVANAQHIKNVPGRKTDVQDAAWIADLLRHGLLQASFIPPLPQRDLRDLTRQRTNLVRERAEVANQLHKVLEWANIKLTSVITDIKGDSARAMLAAIVGGEDDAALLAELAIGRMRSKRAVLEQALTGRVRDHHRFLLAQHLTHLDFLDEQIALFTQQIAATIDAEAGRRERATAAGRRRATPQPAPTAGDAAAPERPVDWARAVELLVTIPGVGRTTAELLIAEVGTDMARFGSAARLASWAKVCPGNNESAGKRYSGRTGHGNAWLRSGLVQAAHSAVVVKDSYFAKVYRRLRVRRGCEARDHGGGASAADGGVPHVAQARAVSGAGTERAGRAAQTPVGPPDATADRAPGLRRDDCSHARARGVAQADDNPIFIGSRPCAARAPQDENMVAYARGLAARSITTLVL